MVDESTRNKILIAVDAALHDPAEWARAIELLTRAGAPLAAPASLAGRLPDGLHLTDAELVVLQSIVDGLDPQAIAAAEGVSVATVRTHISHLHDKFGVSRTIDMLRLVLSEGTGNP